MPPIPHKKNFFFPSKKIFLITHNMPFGFLRVKKRKKVVKNLKKQPFFLKKVLKSLFLYDKISKKTVSLKYMSIR